MNHSKTYLDIADMIRLWRAYANREHFPCLSELFLAQTIDRFVYVYGSWCRHIPNIELTGVFGVDRGFSGFDEWFRGRNGQTSS